PLAAKKAPAPTPTAPATARIVVTVAEDTEPKSTEAIKIAESTTRTPTTVAPSALVSLPLTQGPSTSRSLHSISRNTVALGSSTPASTCTPTVKSPSGEPGISTTAAATPISAAYMA